MKKSSAASRSRAVLCSLIVFMTNCAIKHFTMTSKGQTDDGGKIATNCSIQQDDGLLWVYDDLVGRNSNFVLLMSRRLENQYIRLLNAREILENFKLPSH